MTFSGPAAQSRDRYYSRSCSGVSIRRDGRLQAKLAGVTGQRDAAHPLRADTDAKLIVYKLLVYVLLHVPPAGALHTPGELHANQPVADPLPPVRASDPAALYSSRRWRWRRVVAKQVTRRCIRGRGPSHAGDHLVGDASPVTAQAVTLLSSGNPSQLQMGACRRGARPCRSRLNLMIDAENTPLLRAPRRCSSPGTRMTIHTCSRKAPGCDSAAMTAPAISPSGSNYIVGRSLG